MKRFLSSLFTGSGKSRSRRPVRPSYRLNVEQLEVRSVPSLNFAFASPLSVVVGNPEIVPQDSFFSCATCRQRITTVAVSDPNESVAWSDPEQNVATGNPDTIPVEQF